MINEELNTPIEQREMRRNIEYQKWHDIAHITYAFNLGGGGGSSVQ